MNTKETLETVSSLLPSPFSLVITGVPKTPPPSPPLPPPPLPPSPVLPDQHRHQQHQKIQLLLSLVQHCLLLLSSLLILSYNHRISHPQLPIFCLHYLPKATTTLHHYHHYHHHHKSLLSSPPPLPLLPLFSPTLSLSTFPFPYITPIFSFSKCIEVINYPFTYLFLFKLHFFFQQ